MTCRTIHFNDRNATSVKFVGNSISTTKYTPYNFLLKGIIQQFKRHANLFFLATSILSLLPFSPVNSLSNWVPLTTVIIASLIKEAYEDWQRFQNDRKVNEATVAIWRGRGLESISWKKLKVGDIVRVYKNAFFPADLLFLSCADRDGVCYIETANLDGESHLKAKQALAVTQNLLGSKFEVQCEPPNNSLYTFTGDLILGDGKFALSPNQILLRGCSLRNIEYIDGAVLFTGHETKMMMNSMNVPFKRSTLEKKLNQLMLALFLTLMVMTLIGAIGRIVFSKYKYYYLGLRGKHGENSSYLLFDPDSHFLAYYLVMCNLIALYSTVIPLSLYISIEMIKFVQSTQFINKDPLMYHGNTPALARTSNMIEELGQVEYILSDKTGTLTRNMMEFSKCSFGGELYEAGKLDRGTVEKNMEFFRCLAVCHSVICVADNYHSASPDEIALVIAAKEFGFEFCRRTSNGICVRQPNFEQNGDPEDVECQILNVLEFNSTRKRQSIICRYPCGRLVLYCKGSDDVIFKNLADGQEDLKDSTSIHLRQFGCTGLRTMCLAYKVLDEYAYASWNKKYVKAVEAQNIMEDGHKQLDQVQELIEKDLTLIGCTAVEDKLQEGVPACIQSLTRAGIKIWVMTGDKMETTISIAHACKLINDQMKQFIISSETYADMNSGSQVNQDQIEQEIENKISGYLSEAKGSQENSKFALVIDGNCLVYALSPRLRSMLLDLSLTCDSVVCCRVSPLQKAQVTSMVKGAEKITLSIGDGANDVSMILAANVGIGISGQEGTQAVMASDFSIAQFRFLTDLLLVHGRWSYIRLCKVISYFICKSLTFALTQFWFTFHTGFSGQGFYDDWFQSLYNVIFTALPVIVIGLFEKDVSAILLRKYPELYSEGIKNAFFNWRLVTFWFLSSVYQSLIIFHLVILSGDKAQNSSCHLFGIWEVSTMAYTLVIVTVNLRVLLISSSITKLHIYSIALSIVVFFIFTFIYYLMDSKKNIFVLMTTLHFYRTLFVGPIVALLFDFIHQGMQRWFFPYKYQIIQERKLSSRG